MEKIYIASDHAAFEEKQKVIKSLEGHYEIMDLGTHSQERANYPEFGKTIAKAVLADDSKGIALCGSGIGISIQVNRFKGIRGALCRDEEDAKMSRLHNDSNILCLGARRNSMEEINKIIEVWLSTSFEGGRHKTRIDMLDEPCN